MQGHPLDRLKRRLTLTDATMLVVASVIGSGIFFTPGLVADQLPHPAWIFAAWIAGGVISLAGALTNAELGAMFPRAGGDYVYLRKAIHPLAGFLVGWLTFFAIYAGTIAALALAFGEGLVAWLGWNSDWTLAIALTVTAALSLLNYVGVRLGARTNNLISSVKIAALLAFACIGPFVGTGDLANFSVEATSSISLVAFGLAMSPVLFTYLGWNASLYVASEIRDPGRNIPRSLFAGLAICGGLYLLVNAVYLYAIPLVELRETGDAGQQAAQNLFGAVGAGLVSTFVLISVLGTLNATVLVGPRIAYAMALDGLFFKGAAAVHDRYETPGRAIVVQGVAALALLLLLRSFPSVLDFTTFAILLAAMADVAALFRMRSIAPQQPRPYRAWGYPWVPLLYGLSMAAIALAMLLGRPVESGIATLCLIAGWPFYAWFRRRAGAPD